MEENLNPDVSGTGSVVNLGNTSPRELTNSVLHRNTETGHDLAKRDYWRDDRDRILAWKRGSDNYHNAMEDGRGDRYHYDEEGQLTSASYRYVATNSRPKAS
jgi:hypothetical protein